MKNFLTGLTLSAILLISVSCTKEQSHLTLDSMPSSATITGTVMYYAWGNTDVEGQLNIGPRLPAADITVVARVNNSDYIANSEGIQYFETQTDENGMYTINVPVGKNAANVTLSINPFYRDRNNVLSNSFNMTIVTLKDILYDSATAPVGTMNFNALPNRTYNTDILVQPSSAPYEINFDRRYLVQGKVVIEGWARSETESPTSAYYYERENRGLSNETVRLIVSTNPTTLYPAMSMSVETTTNADGEYSAELMMPTFCTSTSSTVYARVEGSMIEDFTHWYCYEVTNNDPSSPPGTSFMWASQNVPVAYNAHASSSVNFIATDNDVPYQLSTIYVQLVPINSTETIYGVNTWSTASGAWIPGTGSSNNNALSW